MDASLENLILEDEMRDSADDSRKDDVDREVLKEAVPDRCRFGLGSGL